MLAYLDHAATAPLRPVAGDAMMPWLTGRFGNPSGSHSVARAARAAVDDARDLVAASLGVAPSGVVFTGGATEADNLAVAGVLAARPGAVVTTAIEHHAVLHAAERFDHRLVGVGADGVVDLDALAAALDSTVSLVSLMLVNNEVGTIQPLAEAAGLVRRLAPRAVLHTDAVAAMPWLDVAGLASVADLVSISGHKCGGPQGIGVLVVGDGVELAPVTLGGGQERDRRSGTHNVAGIAGLAAALTETVATRQTASRGVAARRDRLADAILATVPDVYETVPRAAQVPGHAHFCIPGVESETLLLLLDAAGVCASAGSACASGALEASHVLLAMGVPEELALGSLRLTLGEATRDDEVDWAAQAVADAVGRLRPVPAGPLGRLRPAPAEVGR